MFRALVFQRSSLVGYAITSLDILKSTPYEDLTQKATTSLTCLDIPTNVQQNDLINYYDTKGKFVYWGVINGIEDNIIKCSQFASIFNDNHLVVPQTTTAQKNFFNNSTISQILSFFLQSKEEGHNSIANTMTNNVPTFTSLIDLDVVNNFQGITHTIVDYETDRYPYPTENGVINLESFVYDMFNNYNRIVKPRLILRETTELETQSEDILTTEDSEDILITDRVGVENTHIDLLIAMPKGNIVLNNGENIDFSSKTLFDTYENISNVSIVKQDEDVNTVYIYNREGTTLRGAYTIKNDGTIVQITDNTSITDRLGSNKTQFIFDSENNVLDLVKSKLPSLQYNHNITFNITFDEKLKFDDFTLGQKIEFYDSKTNTMFDTILTAWEFNVEESSDVVKSATFTLGKVRQTLTARLNKRV